MSGIDEDQLKAMLELVLFSTDTSVAQGISKKAKAMQIKSITNACQTNSNFAMLYNSGRQNTIVSTVTQRKLTNID